MLPVYFLCSWEHRNKTPLRGLETQDWAGLLKAQITDTLEQCKCSQSPFSRLDRGALNQTFQKREILNPGSIPEQIFKGESSRPPRKGFAKTIYTKLTSFSHLATYPVALGHAISITFQMWIMTR